jgi:membrane protease YdiL (CAAX protease family)
MEANLPAAPSTRPPAQRPAFPYANWGARAALFGVVLALGAGVVMGVPAAILGFEHGSVSRYDPATGAAVATFGEGDSSALAAGGGLLYADRRKEVEVFDGSGAQTAGSPFGDIEESHGIAFDGLTGSVLVSDEADNSIDVYTAGSRPRFERQLMSDPRLTLEALAVDESAGGLGVVVAIDRGTNSVVRLSENGGRLATIDATDSPAGRFDFGDPGRNGVAVDNSAGPGAGDIYVVGGADGGSVLAFDRAGRFLWEFDSSGDREFCGVAVDPDGNLWLADPHGGVDEYAPRGRRRPPVATGRSFDTHSDSCAVAFGGSEEAFVAREADGQLTTGANILVQLATALGFLIVPFALAATRGAGSVGESGRRLGLRRFPPSALKWMAAAVGAYLLFTAVYVAIIGEPKQEDIAEGFGAVPIQVLLIVIAAPISEEVCFRGMLFGGLRERLPRVGAALLSGAIFGALHALTGVSAVPPLIAFGFILALLYERTGSIVPGILLHMLNNAVALLGQ